MEPTKQAGEKETAAIAPAVEGNGGNSKANADKGLPYEPIKEADLPAGIKGIITSVNMWATYFRAWGHRARIDVESLEDRVAKLEGLLAARGATHLGEPPDPPYEPAPK